MIALASTTSLPTRTPAHGSREARVEHRPVEVETRHHGHSQTGFPNLAVLILLFHFQQPKVAAVRSAQQRVEVGLRVFRDAHQGLRNDEIFEKFSVISLFSGNPVAAARRACRRVPGVADANKNARFLDLT
jgi:hypothetical protein